MATILTGKRSISVRRQGWREPATCEILSTDPRSTKINFIIFELALCYLCRWGWRQFSTVGVLQENLHSSNTSGDILKRVLKLVPTELYKVCFTAHCAWPRELPPSPFPIKCKIFITCVFPRLEPLVRIYHEFLLVTWLVEMITFFLLWTHPNHKAIYCILQPRI